LSTKKAYHFLIKGGFRSVNTEEDMEPVSKTIRNQSKAVLNKALKAFEDKENLQLAKTILSKMLIF